MELVLPISYFHKEAQEINKALQQYDADLGFGLNEETKQWVVFLKKGSTEATKEGHVPLFGFQKFPTLDEVMNKVRKGDLRKRGTEMLDKAHREAELERRRIKRDSLDHSEAVAEVFDWAFRKEGIHPFPRIFVPKEI